MNPGAIALVFLLQSQDLLLQGVVLGFQLFQLFGVLLRVLLLFGRDLWLLITFDFRFPFPKRFFGLV